MQNYFAAFAAAGCVGFGFGFLANLIEES